MPYRNAIAKPIDDAAEHAAVQALAASSARLRRAVMVPGIVLGLASSFAGYFVLRELQFAWLGLHSPWLAALASSVFFGVWLRVAQRVGRSLVRQRVPSWIEATSALCRVPVATLSEYQDLL